MATGQKTGGRQKGTPNKTTSAVKEAFHHAFKGMGGMKALTAWAKLNQTEFYRLYSKLIPTETSVTLNNHETSLDELR